MANIIPRIITRLFGSGPQPLNLTGGQPLPQPAALPAIPAVEEEWKARLRRMEAHVAIHRRLHERRLAGGGTIESEPLQEITHV